MEKVWKGAPFTPHVTAGSVFYVMQQMQEYPVYIKMEAEAFWKQSTLESIFRDW